MHRGILYNFSLLGIKSIYNSFRASSSTHVVNVVAAVLTTKLAFVRTRDVTLAYTRYTN